MLEVVMVPVTQRKWFYPLIYAILVVISMLPPITEIPYDPRHTQDVIMAILMVAIIPYQSWGWVFHAATLALVLLVALWPRKFSRVVAAYFGINYLLIAGLQTTAVTEQYGFAIQTGATVASGLIGVLWLVVAARNKLQATFRGVPAWRWTLLPFAFLVFWSPIAIEGSKVVPNFDPFLLLTSPDYGLTYCFMTPVFLFLLILFFPQVDIFALRVTAFNGLLYGLFNLTHWFDPDMMWMGVMHLPLLLISFVALVMTHRSPVAWIGSASNRR
jgi:hypothetical protein